MISVVKASVEELEKIHDMAWVVFPHTYRGILSEEQLEYMMEWMYSLPNLRKQIDEGHHYYIAYDDGKPSGYVSVQREGIDEDGVEVFHLHKIYVMPDTQGKGFGKILFERIVSHVQQVKECAAARVELNVNRYNKAVDFYRHLGMRVLMEEDFPIGNGFYKTDYIMGLDL